MRFSIAIAAHNEGRLLERTVTSCLEAIEGLDAEVVVADDASDDGSLEDLRRLYPALTVVAHAERRGVAATKDAAGRAARGEVLLFLDAHCKPEPGAVERLVRDVEEWDGRAILNPAISVLDPDAWACSPDRLGYGFGLDLEWFRCAWIEPARLRTIERGGRTYLRQPALVGCCVAIGRRAYEDLGGFDVGMRSYGSEDLDLGLRGWSLGYDVLVDPESVIGHRFREGLTYPIPEPDPLLNELRMARRAFSDPVWEEWVERWRATRRPETWSAAWTRFQAGRDDLERDRDGLMGRRVRDEFAYAREFGLAWPLVLPASPHPAPPGSRRLDPFDGAVPSPFLSIQPTTPPPPPPPGSPPPPPSPNARNRPRGPAAG